MMSVRLTINSLLRLVKMILNRISFEVSFIQILPVYVRPPCYYFYYDLTEIKIGIFNQSLGCSIFNGVWAAECFSYIVDSIDDLVDNIFIGMFGRIATFMASGIQ